MKNLFQLSLLFILITNFVFAQENNEAKTAIENNLQKLENALQQKDFQKFGSVWTEDAMIKFSGKDPVTSRQAIIDMHRPMAEHGIRIDATTKEVYANNKFATEIGTYKVINADDQTIDTGYYSTLWKKVNGDWLIFRDIISSSVPPQKAEGK
ncbi:hypothetical protein C7S20_17160 [Christiangramia fulva]|uniref:DUF4440 domain-containing protein n=1 Tax=Christiangramia fulva TaxID=2126553 RepID=A0A2R3Z9A2_9FLAO|nr:nuclear transport factor 2 family protein [Christiangramia fulva]AVR46849.1 hypothetical protein C7S20_17160 [Christiangramia fulva]